MNSQPQNALDRAGSERALKALEIEDDIRNIRPGVTSLSKILGDIHTVYGDSPTGMAMAETAIRSWNNGNYATEDELAHTLDVYDAFVTGGRQNPTAYTEQIKTKKTTPFKAEMERAFNKQAETQNALDKAVDDLRQDANALAPYRDEGLRRLKNRAEELAASATPEQAQEIGNIVDVGEMRLSGVTGEGVNGTYTDEQLTDYRAARRVVDEYANAGMTELSKRRAALKNIAGNKPYFAALNNQLSHKHATLTAAAQDKKKTDAEASANSMASQIGMATNTSPGYMTRDWVNSLSYVSGEHSLLGDAWRDPETGDVYTADELMAETQTRLNRELADARRTFVEDAPLRGIPRSDALASWNSQRFEHYAKQMVDRMKNMQQAKVVTHIKKNIKEVAPEKLESLINHALANKEFSDMAQVVKDILSAVGLGNIAAGVVKSVVKGTVKQANSFMLDEMMGVATARGTDPFGGLVDFTLALGDGWKNQMAVVATILEANPRIAARLHKAGFKLGYVYDSLGKAPPKAVVEAVNGQISSILSNATSIQTGLALGLTKEIATEITINAWGDAALAGIRVGESGVLAEAIAETAVNAASLLGKDRMQIAATVVERYTGGMPKSEEDRQAAAMGFNVDEQDSLTTVIEAAADGNVFLSDQGALVAGQTVVKGGELTDALYAGLAADNATTQFVAGRIKADLDLQGIAYNEAEIETAAQAALTQSPDNPLQAAVIGADALAASPAQETTAQQPGITETQTVAPGTAAVAESAPAPKTGDLVNHTIAWGETLSGIAKQHGTTVDAIAAINGISNPDKVYAGQSISVPHERDFVVASDFTTVDVGRAVDKAAAGQINALSEAEAKAVIGSDAYNTPGHPQREALNSNMGAWYAAQDAKKQSSQPPAALARSTVFDTPDDIRGMMSLPGGQTARADWAKDLIAAEQKKRDEAARKEWEAEQEREEKEAKKAQEAEENRVAALQKDEENRLQKHWDNYHKDQQAIKKEQAKNVVESQQQQIKAEIKAAREHQKNLAKEEGVAIAKPPSMEEKFGAHWADKADDHILDSTGKKAVEENRAEAASIVEQNRKQRGLDWNPGRFAKDDDKSIHGWGVTGYGSADVVGRDADMTDVAPGGVIAVDRPIGSNAFLAAIGYPPHILGYAGNKVIVAKDWYEREQARKKDSRVRVESYSPFAPADGVSWAGGNGNDRNGSYGGGWGDDGGAKTSSNGGMDGYGDW